MGIVISYVLVGFGVVTFVLAFSILNKMHTFEEEGILYSGFALSSSLWSFGFAALFMQSNVEYAYYARCFGMAGTFSYLIFGTLLMAKWSNTSNTYIKAAKIFSFTAILLYPFLMQRENTIFKVTEGGMSYVFKSGIWNNLYSLYCVIIAINLLVMDIFMCSNKRRKRIRIMGRRLLICEGVILCGMVLDTTLPLLGIDAIPGSTVAQFFAAVLFYQIYCFDKKNRVEISNMSQFVYYSVEVPVLIYDDRNCLKIVNKSAIDFLEIPQGKEDISLDELFEVDRDLLHQNREVIRTDVRCKVNDAHCRLNINRILDTYEEVLGYIVIIDDLTDKIQSIQELKEAKRQADMANRSKSIFLAQISHEIRTPLNAIMGMDEMILRESRQKKVVEYADYIKEAGGNLLTIVNDILDMSKLETGKLFINNMDYYLSDVIRDVINLVGNKRKEKGLAFELNVESHMPEVLYGDPLRVKQIVSNILSNAVKYTDSGKVTMNVKWRKTGERDAEIIFQIKDTGRGIRKEDMDRMFQPFDRLQDTGKHRVEGYGLGLAITRDLVALMQGHLEVESQVGIGSEFTVTLPQKIGVEAEIASNKEATRRSEKKKHMTAPEARILVVDDTISNLVVVRELLKQTKIKVDMAKSGKDCLRMIEKKQYQIIFLDHMMPEMDGVEVLQEIRGRKGNQNQEIPIVVMTANAVVGSKKRYLECGFTDYISKPVDYEKLEGMLQEYLPDEYIVWN